MEVQVLVKLHQNKISWKLTERGKDGEDDRKEIKMAVCCIEKVKVNFPCTEVSEG
jgi:hypothetical protein